jgi:predicted Zn-dependent protease
MLNGCAVNPLTGSPSFVLSTLDQDKALGERVAAALGREIGHVYAPRTVEYVRAVGGRVAAAVPGNDFLYRFHVLDAVEPNALALPGGQIYVTRGLLVLLNSEDELAVVLGHEIVHVAARHAARSRARRMPLSIVTGMGAFAGRIVNPRFGDVMADAGELASGLVLAPYTRDDEREADEQGQWLAAAAGYDAHALVSFLQTLEREEALTMRVRARAGFFASHPLIPERIEGAAAQAPHFEREPARPIAGDRAAFFERIEGLTVGASAGSGRFVGRAFIHPDLRFTLKFPERWIMHNTQQLVAAQAPDGGAFVALEHVGAGTDPMLGVDAFVDATGMVLDPPPVRRSIGTLQAVHAGTVIRGLRGGAAVRLTWIVHDGSVYRITCLASPREAERYRATFDMITTSFRPLSDAELAAIRETRLRVVRARSGETPAALAARVATVWSPEELAVFNGFESGEALRAGVAVKVAVAEPY